MAALCIGVDARLRAYRVGGIATHVQCLIDGLAELDAPERFVILAHRREAAPGATPVRTADAARGGIVVRRLFTPPHHRLEDWTVPLELAGTHVQLLHATDFVLPRRWRGPGVVTVHDLAFLRHPELVTDASARHYGQVRRSVSRADRVIAVSEHTRRELSALTDVADERVRVVPNAVQEAFSAPRNPIAEAAAVTRYGIREPFVLYVSTIEPRKNVVTLLRAYRQLLDDGLDVDLALVGPDGWRSEDTYVVARELGVRDRARFLGYVPTCDLVAVYRRAAVLAHPALDEGFGISALEAMASGTPAVVADAGALPEVVGDAALRVPPTDIGSWVDALGRVLKEAGLAARLAAAGRERAAAYSPRRMAEQTLLVYREAYASARGEQ